MINISHYVSFHDCQLESHFSVAESSRSGIVRSTNPSIYAPSGLAPRGSDTVIPDAGPRSSRSDCLQTVTESAPCSPDGDPEPGVQLSDLWMKPDAAVVWPEQDG